MSWFLTEFIRWVWSILTWTQVAFIFWIAKWWFLSPLRGGSILTTKDQETTTYPGWKSLLKLRRVTTLSVPYISLFPDTKWSPLFCHLDSQPHGKGGSWEALGRECGCRGLFQVASLSNNVHDKERTFTNSPWVKACFFLHFLHMWFSFFRSGTIRSSRYGLAALSSSRGLHGPEVERLQ